MSFSYQAILKAFFDAFHKT